MNLAKNQTMERSSITKSGDKFTLVIYAKPNSKKEGVADISDDCISISIRAPAVEGKANVAIIEFLSEALDISKSCVTLEKGSKNKNKIVSIEGSGFTNEEEIRKKLSENMI